MNIKIIQICLFGSEVLNSQHIDKERSFTFGETVSNLEMIKFSKSIDKIGHDPAWIESRQEFNITDPNMLIILPTNNTLAISFLKHINPSYILCTI